MKTLVGLAACGMVTMIGTGIPFYYLMKELSVRRRRVPAVTLDGAIDSTRRKVWFQERDQRDEERVQLAQLQILRERQEEPEEQSRQECVSLEELLQSQEQNVLLVPHGRQFRSDSLGERQLGEERRWESLERRHSL